MRVLVTRPLNDALATAANIAARGHQSVVAPLMEIHFREGPEISLDGVRALLVTSSSGALALARRTSRRDVEIFAVADRTAATARAAGFVCVRSAAGDAGALALAAAEWASADEGPLLHATGSDTQPGLRDRLRRLGFAVRTVVIYDAVAALELPATARDALCQDAIDAVLFFSSRSARIFADCVARAGLQGNCRRLAACCIGNAAADVLAPLLFRDLRVAPHPDQESVLALLDF